ncbi:MFS transporter [Micractinium conductrix]|uniref:MFS transporter n=1 Tax=Micractinium conductrix TaxID=554055 RepID=A0A2P6V3J6_9CHLO|nr:MFS transporter [Micractinium conductrix]|eukprot:PSC68662.1 MFS transporter [Micractinium conductrix]
MQALIAQHWLALQALAAAAAAAGASPPTGGQPPDDIVLSVRARMPGAVTESCPAAVSPEALAPLQWELAAQLQVTPSSKQPALKAGVLKELAEGARRHPRLAAALAASGLLREGLQACQQLGEQQVEQVMRCIALCAVTVKALGGEAAGCAASLASHAQQAGSGVGAEPPPAGLAEQLAAPAPRSL